MAKRRTRRRRSSGPNKAPAIRDALNASGMDTPTKDIVAKLAEQGVVVSSAHVSNIKSTMRKGAGAANGRGRRPRKSAGDQISLANLIEAKRLADRLGGVEAAKALFDALSRLN